MVYVKSIVKQVFIGLFLFTGVNSYAAIDMKLIEFWDDVEPQSLINVDHSAFKQILTTYTSTDHPSGIERFDYASVTESDRNKLNEYLDYLQLLEPRQLNEAEAKAYWVNLYNAATLKMVLDVYAEESIDSILDVKSGVFSPQPWERKLVTIAQQTMTLSDLLHGVIRPLYKDPRMHYALFFCSQGGPDMSAMILEGENNEEVLNTLEQQYLSKSRAVRLDDGELVLSSIFENYDTDFAPNLPSLISYLKQHVPEPVAVALDSFEAVRYEYEWDLNAP